MAHHPHRVRRWLIGGALGLVGLVVLAVVAVFVILQTPWGRSTLERKVVAALDDVIEGDVEIGAIDGNLADRAVLKDVVIRDARSNRR